MGQKIDFVIAWVDGSDPVWQADKEKYTGIKAEVDDCRYRDWDLLRYWFRGVEKFAPWVNTIHFVTYGHLPAWLNKEHSKLHIVIHHDYIPKLYLPTFNSNCIELNFHRIPNLTEQFVYFNDDMFIIRNVEPSDFFINGLPKDTFAFDSICFSKNSIAHINGNNIACINDAFSKCEFIRNNLLKIYSLRNGIRKVTKSLLLTPFPYFTGFFYDHLPSSLLKSSYLEAWDRFESEINNTCIHRVRDNNDVNQWLIKYLQFVKGKFVIRNSMFGKCYNVNDDNINEIVKVIKKQVYGMICINDNESINSIDKYKSEIINSFDLILPEKSDFEV